MLSFKEFMELSEGYKNDPKKLLAMKKSKTRGNFGRDSTNNKSRDVDDIWEEGLHRSETEIKSLISTLNLDLKRIIRDTIEGEDFYLKSSNSITELVNDIIKEDFSMDFGSTHYEIVINIQDHPVWAYDFSGTNSRALIKSAKEFLDDIKTKITQRLKKALTIGDIRGVLKSILKYE